MSYQDKQYVSPVGTDFTEYVNTQEDADKFEKMCEHENRCIDVPAKDCIHDVVAALNLGRELKNIPQKVHFIGHQNAQMN